MVTVAHDILNSTTTLTFRSREPPVIGPLAQPIAPVSGRSGYFISCPPLPLLTPFVLPQHVVVFTHAMYGAPPETPRGTDVRGAYAVPGEEPTEIFLGGDLEGALRGLRRVVKGFGGQLTCTPDFGGLSRPSGDDGTPAHLQLEPQLQMRVVRAPVVWGAAEGLLHVSGAVGQRACRTPLSHAFCSPRCGV